MKNETNMNPLLIAGIVLLVNAFVFLLLAVSFGMYEFLGVVVGCLGAGIGLTVSGLLKKNRKQSDTFV